jgi:tripartite ATP-independent transporter DctM subunit
MLVLLGSLAVSLILGIPIAYSLGLSALCYFALIHPEFLTVLPQRFYSGMDSYSMIALPLFVLMGSLMNEGGITTRLIEFSLLFVGRLRGGLGLVNVLASMIFGGISGSSVSDTASIGAVLIPEMKKKGYSAEFASGITVASSTMGMIIPPSIPMVIYSHVSEESVGKLFLGSMIPGVMIGLFMLIMTLGISTWKRYPKEEVSLTRKEILATVERAGLALLMPIIIIGSVVFGIATTTESAAIGVIYAFIVGYFIIKGLKLRKIPSLLKSAILTSANVMVIIALSQLYIWILAIERIPQWVAGVVTELNLSAPVFILLFIVIVIITGTFVDVSPAILLLTPVFLSAMLMLGVTKIQFGVILICGLAVGLVTPPVGMCLNVASAISRLSIVTIFRAALPFLLANLLTLILLSVFPQLSTWLPAMLMK